MPSNVSALDYDPPANVTRPTELEALRRILASTEPITQLDLDIWRCELAYVKRVRGSTISQVQMAQYIVSELKTVTLTQVLHTLNRFSIKLMLDTGIE